jgi:DNA-binding PadR family transcriptional regulator
VIRDEFGISQPAVSAQLRVLRESGFATVRAEGTRRIYAVTPEPLREVDDWLDRFRAFWTPHLDALARGGARAPGAPRDTGHREETAMMDVSTEITATARQVETRALEAGEARAVILARTYFDGPRGPVGCVYQSRADPALVPAGLR